MYDVNTIDVEEVQLQGNSRKGTQVAWPLRSHLTRRRDVSGSCAARFMESGPCNSITRFYKHD